MPAKLDLIGERYGRLLVIKEYAHRGSNQRVLWECTCDCGNTVTIQGDNLRSGNTVSCGCYKDEVELGSTNNNWKGGITDKISNTRGLADYSQWRFNVFSRDNFICQVCGSKGGKLNAHHIHSFARYPKYRTVVENGVTLCEGCHKEFHSLYGTMKFTSDDYFEWVST